MSGYQGMKASLMSKLSRPSVVFVSGCFDDIKTNQIRFLQEASNLGRVHVLLFSDKTCDSLHGNQPKYPETERRYYLEAIRYVDRLTLIDRVLSTGEIPHMDGMLKDLPAQPIWAVQEADANSSQREYCAMHGMQYQVIPQKALSGFPIENIHTPPDISGKKKVIVSGCFDWVHSGHIRFFEEVSEFGDLYVVIGHDENLKLLKGEGHPLFQQDERRYWVQSIRFVKEALISSGNGWLDAEPEILKVKPDIYAVNEDGDKPEKRNFCLEHGIEYKVLKRQPKPGLPVRISSELRGF